MPDLEFAIHGDPLEVGTRLHWDAAKKCIYYVDVPTGYIYKYIPATGIIRKAKVGIEPLAFAFPVKNTPEQFIGGLARKFILFNWDGESKAVQIVKIIGEIESSIELSSNRLNGAKVDPAGRLWAGTMGPAGPDGNVVPGRGSLYSVDQNIIKKHADGISISNGLDWDINAGKMYYCDTLSPNVYQFDYDHVSGNIGNRQIIYRFLDEVIKSPDGLTLDCDGNIWVAMIFGSKIFKIDPRSQKLLQYIHMQTPQVTSLCWGDEDLRTLYVTTAQIPEDEKKPEYPAGCLFSIKKVGVRGLPSYSFIKGLDEEESQLVDRVPSGTDKSPHYVF